MGTTWWFLVTILMGNLMSSLGKTTFTKTSETKGKNLEKEILK